jgi:hypothetical protein
MYLSFNGTEDWVSIKMPATEYNFGLLGEPITMSMVSLISIKSKKYNRLLVGKVISFLILDQGYR